MKRAAFARPDDGNLDERDGREVVGLRSSVAILWRRQIMRASQENREVLRHQSIVLQEYEGRRFD